MADFEVPVLIVGGGGCGLTTSILLSDLGVKHLLVERHATTSHIPKAHYLNQRTMEIFRQHRVADSIYAVGTPPHQMAKVRWRTSLGGDGPLDARTFHEIDAFGGGAVAPRYAKDSPCPSSNYPQLRLEPLLRRHAEERAPGAVHFSHELLTLEQDDAGVTCTIADLQDDRTYTVRAQYVVAADGSKTVGPMLGVELEGPTGVGHVVTSHVTADLSQYWDDACLITWFISPDGGGVLGAGAMVPMGPTWGRHSEEWVIHFSMPKDTDQRFDEENVVPRLRNLLKLPDFNPTVHRISEWTLDAVLADRYQVGRVFLAGDAAHRHPPTTGLGLNTAVGDAHNLAWKLALVLRGKAPPALLESYEIERRPVGRRNVDWAMFTAMNHAVVDAGMGFSSLQSEAQRRANFEIYFSDTPMGATRRARAAEVINTQRTEFQAHDLEIGYVYEAGAVVPDGTPAPPRDPMGGLYVPSTRPGHRLPHAWLERDGTRLSTHDLADRNAGFVLLTGHEGAAWAEAAAAVAAAHGVALRCVVVGQGGYADVGDSWGEENGIGADGAVLVRPDNHVAWRSAMGVSDARAVLDAAVARVLGK